MEIVFIQKKDTIHKKYLSLKTKKTLLKITLGVFYYIAMRHES